MRFVVIVGCCILCELVEDERGEAAVPVASVGTLRAAEEVEDIDEVACDD